MHSSSFGPSSPMPSSAPTVYSSEPAAASSRCAIGTHLDFGHAVHVGVRAEEVPDALGRPVLLEPVDIAHSCSSPR